MNLSIWTLLRRSQARRRRLETLWTILRLRAALTGERVRRLTSPWARCGGCCTGWDQAQAASGGRGDTGDQGEWAQDSLTHHLFALTSQSPPPSQDLTRLKSLRWKHIQLMRLFRQTWMILRIHFRQNCKKKTYTYSTNYQTSQLQL